MQEYTRTKETQQQFSFRRTTRFVRSTAAQAGPRTGRPPKSDEREFFLPLMRQAGQSGINRNDFLKGTGPLNGRQITQVGRLVHSLEREGYIFKHERRDGEPFVTYVLVAEPNEPRKPMSTVRQSSYPPQGGHEATLRQSSSACFQANEPAQPSLWAQAPQPALSFAERERGIA